jgi:hypothetical protein
VCYVRFIGWAKTVLAGAAIKAGAPAFRGIPQAGVPGAKKFAGDSSHLPIGIRAIGEQATSPERGGDFVDGGLYV